MGRLHGVTGFVLLILVGAGMAQETVRQPELRFDAAVIRRDDAAHQRSGILPSGPDRFVAVGVPVATVAGFAYDRSVDGLPSWARTERYSITAKASGPVPVEQIRGMVRALLADRLQLVAHVETTARAGLALVRLAPDGPLPSGLREVACTPADAIAPHPSTGPAPSCLSRDTGTVLIATGVPMQVLADTIAGAVGTPVIDATGLPGRYAFELRRHAGDAPAANGDAPDIATAIREQLGLTLVPRRVTQDRVVVDRIARPTDN